MSDTRFIEQVSRAAASVIIQQDLFSVHYILGRDYDYLVVPGDAEAAVRAPGVVVGMRSGRAYECGIDCETLLLGNGVWGRVLTIALSKSVHGEFLADVLDDGAVFSEDRVG